MNVKELIEKLQNLNPEAKVIIHTNTTAFVDPEFIGNITANGYDNFVGISNIDNLTR